MRTANVKPLTVLGAIPVVVTVSDNEVNIVTEFLHIIAKLSALYISKNCIKELNILNKLFLSLATVKKHYTHWTLTIARRQLHLDA